MAVSPAMDSASTGSRPNGTLVSSCSTPRCWYPNWISRWSTSSPAHWKRKWPGSMMPACTGPTATSCTDSPSTR